MFERVLVPTDLSENSRRSIACTAQIPGVKEVIVQYVLDATTPSRHGWLHEKEVENARLELEEIKAGFDSTGISVVVKLDILHEGEVGERILETARKQNVDLIVIGARGKGIVQGILIGSVASSVIRNAVTNVLVLRHKLLETLEGDRFEKFCPNLFSRILCPTDFSPPSDAAITYAAGIQGVSEIALLHVVATGETHDEITKKVREAREQLDKTCEDLEGRGIKGSVHVRVGDPVSEIEHIGEELDTSLTMMSPYGKGLVNVLLSGSTTLGVVRGIRQPLLIVKPGTVES